MRLRSGTSVRAFAAAASLAFALGAGWHPPAAADPTSPATTPADSASLAPTSDPPWNPPRAERADPEWQSVARLPGHVIALPFTLVNMVAKWGFVFVDENEVVPKLAAHVSLLQNVGLSAAPASLGERTGFGGVVLFSPPFFPWFDASLSGSTIGYSRGRVAFVSQPAIVEYQSDWRPRDLFFGVGPGTRRQDASNFATQTDRVRVLLRYPFVKSPPRVPNPVVDDPASVTVTPDVLHPVVQVWAGPRDVVQLNGREHDSEHAPIAERFPALAGALIGERVEHFVYGASVGLDRRSGRPHWWRGWRTFTSVERYDQPVKAFALRSASTPSVSFTRTEASGEAAWSFWTDPRTFRVFARVVDERGVRAPGVFVLGDLATLGGGMGLSGFEPGRFHDADSMVGRLTYVYPLARYLEMDVHAETGEVMPRLGAARMRGLEHSYGFSVRARNPFAPIASAGMDWSRETVRFRFSIGGVE